MYDELRKRGHEMAKIDLDSLSIEELAALRENATAKLLEKVAKRQAELEAEMDKLTQYGKPAKKALPEAAKPKKSESKKSEEAPPAEDPSVSEAA
jgi:hypothetical protein